MLERQELLVGVFNKFDVDKTGYIEVEEIQSVLCVRARVRASMCAGVGMGVGVVCECVCVFVCAHACVSCV